jgi:SAM-dependent methyltransferase
MADINDYLNMQNTYYDQEASKWSLENRDPVVGSYDDHNAWADYDEFLFKDIDTTGKIALDYGCGPGRGIVRFKDRFKRIDGVDISKENLKKAKENARANGIKSLPLLLKTNGDSIPKVGNDAYDIVFSTICLQHICCHAVRFSFMKDIYRVLKKGGHFCFQMGFGGRGGGGDASYFENKMDATETNGGCDVVIGDPNDIKTDLENIGFVDFSYDIRPAGPGDTHVQWIFVRATK